MPRSYLTGYATKAACNSGSLMERGSCHIGSDLMRRLLSLVLVALFWAGPLSALMPGSEQARLPACCRRHGAHHCAMISAEGASAAPGRTFASPARCPRYHRSGPATAPAFTPAAQLALAKF